MKILSNKSLLFLALGSMLNLNFSANLCALEEEQLEEGQKEKWESAVLFKGEVHGVNFIWSPDGKRYAMYNHHNYDDYTIGILDVDKGECLKVLKGHEDIVNSLSWGPDGKRLASGSSDGTTRIWDVDKVECLHVLRIEEESVDEEGIVRSVSWSPDGKRIASGYCDGTIGIWDVDKGECLHVLRIEEESVDEECIECTVLSVSWSPDGKRIASGGSWDGTTRIWDADKGKCLNVLRDHRGARVTSVSWSTDGKRVASSSLLDGTIRIWKRIDEEACQRKDEGSVSE